jgi:hypothetical protein
MERKQTDKLRDKSLCKGLSMQKNPELLLAFLLDITPWEDIFI